MAYLSQQLAALSPASRVAMLYDKAIASLREAISVVHQEPMLFARSIRENHRVEFDLFRQAVIEVEGQADFLIVDTPGFDTHLTRLAHSLAFDPVPFKLPCCSAPRSIITAVGCGSCWTASACIWRRIPRPR